MLSLGLRVYYINQTQLGLLNEEEMKKGFLKVSLLALTLSFGGVLKGYAGMIESTLIPVAGSEVKVGEQSPGFSYKDINGKTVTLADLKGKPVYIDIWATWCPPCRAELPYLKKLEEKYGDKIHFVSISCDMDKSKWEKMMKDQQLGGIQLHFGNDQELMQAYGVTGIPRFILLDANGKVLSPDMTRPSDAATAGKLDELSK